MIKVNAIQPINSNEQWRDNIVLFSANNVVVDAEVETVAVSEIALQNASYTDTCNGLTHGMPKWTI